MLEEILARSFHKGWQFCFGELANDLCFYRGIESSSGAHSEFSFIRAG